MKFKNYIFILLIGLVFFIFFAGIIPKEKNLDNTLTNTYYDYKTVDINQISFPLSNTGNIDWTGTYQMVTWDQIYQINDYNTIVYDQGLWVLGKINDIPYWAYGKWSSTYSPGPVINGQASMLIHPGGFLLTPGLSIPI